jgi:hypothetical protein
MFGSYESGVAFPVRVTDATYVSESCSFQIAQ